MVRLLFSIALLLLVTSPVNSQEKAKTDRLVILRIIDFKNTYEKEVFECYYKDTTKNLEPLFFTVSAMASDFKNADQRLSDWLRTYPDKEKVINGDRKAVKKFYQETHNKFLDKYVIAANYSDIFTKGEYNCVSASILFGSLLQKLSIPFVVKISPNHVFLVAFPNTTPTIIETTNPMVGTVVFTEKYKKDYLKQLREQKLISEKEFKNTSIDELFYFNYFNCKTAPFSALIGAQYYNKGLSSFSNQKIEDAFTNLQKASLFMSSESSAGALTIATVGVITLRKWDSEITYSAYKQLVRLPDSLLIPEAIKSEIKYLANDRIQQHKDTVSFNKAYTAMMSAVTREDIKTYLYTTYNSAIGELYLQNEKPDKAYPYLRDAYLADTTQKDLLRAICQSLFYSYNKPNPDELFTNYKRAKEELPILSTNRDYLNTFGGIILMSVNKQIMAAQLDKADALLLEFEKEIPTSLTKFPEEIIDNTYGKMVKHYYRKKNNKKALQLVNRGLAYNPYSLELGEMKRILGE